MSEYWKSIPKYWCKFCSTYVKDTKFEKAQHEATGKHQGCVQRSLRNLHKEHDKEEREKQRAKDEVARLNGIVTGKVSTVSTWKPSASTSSASIPKQVTTEDRKKQMQQLADMGVVVPEAFRKEVAMAGEWQTVARKVDESNADALSFGVRKRKLDEEDEEEAAQAALANKNRWGTAIRAYPGKIEQAEDIETLLMSGLDSKAGLVGFDSPAIKVEEGQAERQSSDHHDSEPTPKDEVEIKREDDSLGILKIEDSAAAAPPVVFKKRKAKILR